MTRAWPSLLGLLLLIAAAWSLSSPVAAHKEHKKPPAAAASTDTAKAGPIHAQMGEMIDRAERPPDPKRGVARLLDWLGRLHPVIVHFPIAFFPAALVTAIVGRRRPSFAAPVQFLVVAGGVIAPVAALLGWFDAGFAPAGDEALLSAHRWLGTGIGLAALALAVWAWRRPGHDRSPPMIAALAAITAAIVVQGWFGGALVHGLDHMNW